MTLRAVLFDVDFTLARPGPELGPVGYVRAGERHGLALDAGRYGAAREAALERLERLQPDLRHDDEIWFAFTERVVIGMGGTPPASRTCAVEITRGWERHENFDLYDDVLPTLAALRRAGLLIGLVSNSARDVREFAGHHGLDVDAGISSFHHGRTKPHASIFRAVLDLLDVEPADAAMVGDTIADDIDGARAVGMRAILLDRENLRPEFEPRIASLAELRGAGLKLGLVSNAARDVLEFARHHALEVDAGISSFHHGRTKPHASIFRAVLELLEVAPEDAAMVGDTIEADIEGALAIGMRAVLVDRLGREQRYEPRVESLRDLPAALRLPTL